MQHQAVPAQLIARDSVYETRKLIEKIRLVSKHRLLSLKTNTYSSLDFDEAFIFGVSSVQVDTVPEDAMVDWMSNPLPLCLDFPDSTFDDLNLDGQTPFFPTDFNNSLGSSHHGRTMKIDSRVQSLRESNLSRTFKSLSTVADSLPPQHNFPESIGTSANWGHILEVLEPDSESNCIRKLSQLSIDLFEHSNTVPPLSIYDPPPSNLEDNPVSPSPQDYSGYHIDETFRLTQSLINIYPTFLNAFLPHPMSESSNASSTRPSDKMSNTHFQTAQHPAASLGSASRASAMQNLDHSSILLLLACHLRLINIYEALFKHMHACFKQGGIALTPQQATLNPTPLKIGSFEPPPSTAIPMQMLLLVQFASQLFNYAADLASELGLPEEGTPNSESSNGDLSDNTLALTRAAAENVKSRAGNMSKELAGAMKALMLQSGHLA